MLKGIDPLLTPDLLKVLAEMGHGDEIVIADANFTAKTLAEGPHGPKPLIHLPGAGVERVSQAVLSLLPLDAAVDQPVAFMKVCDTPEGYLSALQRRMLAQLAAAGHAQPGQCKATERFAFYDRVRRAQAIVLTGELQPYGNFLFKKGVIGEVLAP
ncbi:RbsD/FucU family protein [Ideonella livida]|uniref:RbsD or FucU transport n=1 Tax=Ideonella livida TaxID=2707176 RepID=A0A7C9TM10_9BURK|nr:RbsD/FucU domain-containing protein [Ideonella livida]NDY92982.1 RbsD or FucU transport [Ideonella livida]